MLRDYHPNVSGPTHHPISVTLTGNHTVRVLLSSFNIPEALVAGVAINGETAALTDTLNAEDSVRIFPPVAGG